jgi:hypothetical protein
MLTTRTIITAGAATIAVAAPPVVAQPGSDDGFAWGDAGIGAAGMLGVIGIVTGVGVLTIRRRRDDVAIPTH